MVGVPVPLHHRVFAWTLHLLHVGDQFLLVDLHLGVQHCSDLLHDRVDLLHPGVLHLLRAVRGRDGADPGLQAGRVLQQDAAADRERAVLDP